VIRAAIEKQSARTHCVHLHNPALSRAEFVEMLAARFGLSERARTSKTGLLLELEQLLQQRRDSKETTVLIVDEAQSLPLELLEEIRLLTNIETNAEKLLSLVIAGQPEIATRFTDQSLRQLKQRIALRCELKPLTLTDTAAYLAGRIRAAGGVGAQVFTREAVSLIHDHSRGIPRTINVLADNALVGGFAAGQRPVGSQIVRDVCRDFDIPLGHGQVGDAAQGQKTMPGGKPEKRRLLETQRAEGGDPDGADTGEAEDRPQMFQAARPRRRRLSFFGM